MTNATETGPDAGFDLVVETVREVAQGVVEISLRHPQSIGLPSWTPGAHIDLIVDGRLERHYSLCGDPADSLRWRIAVLRETTGRGGSEWIHANLRAGDVVRVRGPRNNFALVEASEYLFIGGGIGITPLLALIREVAARGLPWRLLYGGRTRSSMAYVEELQSLGPNVEVRPQDVHGLLDLGAWLGEPRPDVAVYCCGPEKLIEAVEKQCAAWPEDSLHVERFRPREVEPSTSGTFQVILDKSGRSCSVGPDESIIDALDRIGVYVPRSCGEGTCGTCLTRVLQGTPEHRDSFLVGRKRASNDAMCVCCSRSLTSTLVLDL
jgi:ferredoxin-NADP reductase